MDRHASMNRFYRLVWSEVRSAFIPVAETSRARGKCARARAALKAQMPVAAALLGLAYAPTAPAAGPAGGQIVSGGGSITQSGTTTDIRQSTPYLSIDWSSFNIAAQETVDFIQPAASAIAVNRILGTNGTVIMGRLEANGQVYLINPNGVVFGKGSEVDVGGLVASTLELNDTGLGGPTFSGGSEAGIVNQSTLRAGQGGYVALIGNHVSNQGLITARLGTVALGAGSAVTLTFSGDDLLHLQVDRSVLRTLVQNHGLIQADGGQVIMTAGARDSILASAVNNSGVIEARTVENHEGVISLVGGAVAGTVDVGGTLDASAPEGGSGGHIETSAAAVQVADGAKVTTAAAAGLHGSWLVDPNDFTVAPSGGDITGATLSADLGSTSVTLQSSSGSKAGGGNVNVNDNVAWAANTSLTLTASNNVNVSGTITATGATAGLAVNPNTANGSQASSGTGTFDMVAGSSITLSGANATVTIGSPAYNLGTGATLNLPNVAPTSTRALVIGGTPFTVINSLGAPGSTSGTDLQGLNGNLSGHYALGSNLDATATSTWNGGAGFTPIGAATFAGTFDGLGHTITNLMIDVPASNNVGLFSYTSPDAVIRNVGLIGGSVSGSSYVGELVGVNFGRVANSYVTGTVSGTGDCVGGLAGYNHGSIGFSYAAGDAIGASSVSGVNYVGGLVGYDADGAVSFSYATSGVSGAGSVGGLVGFNDTLSTIGESYTTGAVIGSATSAEVGGLVGWNTGSVSTSYATGQVKGSTFVGGLIGYSSGTVTESYWNETTSGQPTSSGGTGLTNAQMKTASSLAGFGFTNTPGLLGNNWVIVDSNGTLNNAGGSAGSTFPMLSSEYSTTIDNAHQLQLMEMNPAANYRLGQNIDAAGTGSNGDIWGTSGLVPIGNSTTAFTGTLDGQGYTISDLGIFSSSSSDVGLFGVVGAAGAVKNVGIEGGSINGSSNVGALAGVNMGTVSNSFSGAAVFGASSVGGLVGNNSGAIQSAHTGNGVSGGSYAGGLVGYNTGSISESYSAGFVNGTSLVGGLVGWSTGKISNSYATGSVSGGNYVGGLVGDNYAGGVISNSYATGSVKAGAYAGGLVGVNAVGSTITNSYATGAVNGTYDIGGLVGSNYGPVSNSYATGSVTGSSQDVGGLVGNNYGATISNSYALGAVSAPAVVGGLVGFNSSAIYYSSTAVISDSYSIGKVSGSTFVGGLVGAVNTGNYGGTISNSYWNVTTSGQGASAGGEGLTSAQMHTASNFAGFTFTTTPGASGWVMVDADGTLNNAGGVAGATLPMLASEYSTVINNLHRLQLMAMNVSGSFTLAQNLDATATSAGTDVWGSSGFVPIGNAGAAFSGVFDGMGHFIGNLTINLPTTNEVGLFGSNGSAGVIRNLGLIGGTVNGSNDVGGLAGANYGSISNSYATASVTAAEGNVGGLVGYNKGGTLLASYATGSVKGKDNGVGGLVGANSYGTIDQGYATGAVTGTFWVGGLVGETVGGSISASYATGGVTGFSGAGGLIGVNYGNGKVLSSYAVGLGTVSGSNYVGGLVGFNQGTIRQSYSTESVSGSYAIGGLVGLNGTDGISASYATGSVSGATNANYAGGLVGINEGSITNSYATGAVRGSYAVGGLVGGNGVGSSVSTSYSAGTVAGTSDVGGMIGNAGGVISNSFWNVTTSGQSASSGGIGMTTSQMQTEANFISATTANGNVNPGWDLANTWVIYSGHTEPLLRSFMIPLTVTANNLTTTYDGKIYSGGYGANYSTTVNENLLGTLSFGGASQTAVNAGAYDITPSGLYSNQQGYLIGYANGSLTINQLASVAWTGGTTGNWSNAANWAGGAIPDYANVAAVTIPAGVSVTYDAGVPGSTTLNSLMSSGNLTLAAGSLRTLGNLNTAGFRQTGGTLTVGGRLTVQSTAGGVILGDIRTGSLSISSETGAITQLAGTSIDSAGPSTLQAGRYAITLANSANEFAGAITANGSNIDLATGEAAGFTLGNIDATGLLTLNAGAGGISQLAGTAVDAGGSSLLNAGGGKYGIMLVNSGNEFGAAVAADGDNIDLATQDASGLTLGNIKAAGTLTLSSRAGAIGQTAGTALSVNGLSTISADNGLSGTNDIKYGITLKSASNSFKGALSSDGQNITLEDSSTAGLTLGSTTATGTLSALSLDGALTQASGKSIAVTGTSTLNAGNYAITLAGSADRFLGAVNAAGSAITLTDFEALTATVASSGAVALSSRGKMRVSGTVGTNLTTVTTGTNGTTTFGDTTVGDYLDVTSTGTVSATTTTALTVHGARTSKTPGNPNVTVNGVVGATIP